ncbi:sphingomyelin synthase family protein [Patescibacteria group bacterium]|nr:sphingomyelin synthase family protein [Patescibacteria group bacterium]
MNRAIAGVISRYKQCFSDPKFVWSFIFGVIAIAIGIAASIFAILYATEAASNSVTDLILSNIPVFDVDWAFVYGPLIFWGVVVLYTAWHPERLPFVLKSLAVFLVIRSAFVSLTHISPFPVHVQIDAAGFMSIFTTGKDQFFSGHTGLPFMVAMIYWRDKFMRKFALISSFFFAVVVLLGHLHYSIDVFAAFFITYSIFHITLAMFHKDRLRFLGQEPLPAAATDTTA